HPSAYSSSTHLPAHFHSRPGTGSNHSRPATAAGLTVHIANPPPSDRIEIVTGPSPTSPAFKPSGSVRENFIRAQGSAGSANLSPKSARDACVSPTLASPSSQYLVPSLSSGSAAYTRNTQTQHSPTETATGIYTHNRSPRQSPSVPSPTSEKIPGFPVVPPSPATAAFLRAPVAPPSTHTSHEGLLEPQFIRSLMQGIEHEDGSSLDGPFGHRYAGTEHRDSINSYSLNSIASSSYPHDPYHQHPYEYSVEDVHTHEPDDLPLEPPRGFFRRAPQASLPSSPRSSFSLSVRSGVTGRGYAAEDVPEVPKIPDAFRPAQSKRRSVVSTTTGVTGTGTMTGTEETGVVQHAVIVRTASHRRPAVYRTTDDLKASSPVSLGGSPTRAVLTTLGSPLSGSPSAPLPHAPTASPIPYTGETSPDPSAGKPLPDPHIGKSLPDPYTEKPLAIPQAGKTSPIPYAGTRDLAAHVRTTSRDLSLGGDVVRRKSQLATLSIPGPRPRERSVVVEEDGDDLVYVRGEDVRREREARYEGGRESRYEGGRESRYEARES
ncbi:hypothetical protein FRC11_002617, partial [Ceratobasidium sp. 423]